MKTAVLLAAGEGRRVWPFAEARPKAMLPAANRPLLGHQVDSLLTLGFEHIVIAAGPMHQQITNFFRDVSEVDVRCVGSTEGSAFSLAAAVEEVTEWPLLVLPGDCLLSYDDIAQLAGLMVDSFAGIGVLAVPLGQDSSRDWIGCRVEDGRVTKIAGHPRGGVTHRLAGFVLGRAAWPYVTGNSGVFSSVEVGMMPPLEGYVEMALADWLRAGEVITSVEALQPVVDVDKPWHIMEANALANQWLCDGLGDHQLENGAFIDDSASIEGCVRLGAGSRIGRNVVIQGNVWVGDHTIIDNGAIVRGPTVIGNHCRIENYCYIGGPSTIGDQCVVNHCAELEGVIFDTVYLYHYMEFFGVLGRCTDLGAATVCGTLRFDDGSASWVVNGRRETPRNYANASYIADYCRTGVNAVLMPGCRVGIYSVVGPGVVLRDDVPNRTMVQVEQTLTHKPWGPERYGW